MFNILKTYLTPPVFENDEDKTRTARMLNFLTLALTIGAVIIIVYMLITGAGSTGLLFAFALFLVPVLVQPIIRLGYINTASTILSLALWLLFGGATILGGTGNATMSNHIILILLSGLLLGLRGAVVFGVLSALTGLVLVYVQINDLLPPAILPITPVVWWLNELFNFGVTVVVLYLATSNLKKALERARRNERTLRESEERFRSVVEHSQVGVFIIDNAFHFIFTNDALGRILGREPDEVIGMDFREVLDEESRQVVAEYYLRRQRGEEAPSRYECKVVRKNGEVRQVNIHAVRAQDPVTGQPRSIGQMLDITERVQAEQDRAQLQEQIIQNQRQMVRELSTPIIPLSDQVIAMPLIGAIDTDRARDIMRALLEGITRQRARVVIMDITGVQVIDSEVASYLDKAIQAARLKGAHTVITGISDSVAETIVDLGIDWGNVETVRDLQTGLAQAAQNLGGELTG